MQKYLTKIKKQIMICFSNQINFPILFLALALGLISSSLLILACSNHTGGLLYLLAKVNWLRELAKLIIKANTIDLLHSTMLNLFGSLFIFLFSVISLTRVKNSAFYIIWTFFSIIFSWLLIMPAEINVAILVNSIAWLYFTSLWLINRLYHWVIAEQTTILAKLTFVWGILAVIISYIING
ncbi:MULTISPECIES: hypothetical protein [unclassified Lactobacillus]|uniref:hypothetical protein n=1 Tax=unclassified Lactobacillus TaxID=2620435 RepID=UPI000EFD7FBB|nr:MULTISPECIES: hypothetical protein [unclassified Lactobacillus]RMC38129.1 hypothetical protein F5ESL0237_07780 [Lactobacillus sp. ESL0237]RMC42660.1 hypothetical protein F5ESL0234_07675 [Lactobacillus sp. ESL0234]RMC43357.1 hypothetical protein F5ESL0236_07805 [Lactobacillus sp. ESL0236]RMC47873.1 hypothetical protein F5ESL0225_08035 [Lactobacillus sp. ESL0225]